MRHRERRIRLKLVAETMKTYEPGAYRDEHNRVYVVLPNGKITQKGRIVGTVAVFEKGYDLGELTPITEQELYEYVYKGITPQDWEDSR